MDENQDAVEAEVESFEALPAFVANPHRTRI
jgi:hypothetical protein